MHSSSSSGLGISYSSANTAIALVKQDSIYLKTIGTVQITAFQTGNDTLALASSTQILTITKQSQTITFDTLETQVYKKTPFLLHSSSSSGLGISYSSANTAIALVKQDSIYLKSGGTVQITAFQTGNDTLAPASSTQILTITKQSQTITFDTLESQVYKKTPFLLHSSSSSGLGISYSSANTAIALVKQDSIYLKTIGTVQITAFQTGNDTLALASSTQILTITKQSQTITFDSIPDKTYGDNPFLLQASASSGLPISFISSNSDIIRISNDTVYITGRGTVEITASQTGNDTVDVAFFTQGFFINKQSQTITFDSIPDKTYGDNPFLLQASASSGLPISFISSNSDIIRISNDTVYITGGGNGRNNCIPNRK